MLPVRVQTFISAPREQIFDLLADMAARPSWTDHYMKDFRLENPRSFGVGAAARYRLDAPFYRLWVEAEIVEADRPRRVVEANQGTLSVRDQPGSGCVFTIDLPRYAVAA